MSVVAFAMIAPAIQISGVTTAQGVDDVNSQRLRDAVTVGGILSHERVFQRIANNNDGTRASGTPGFDASANYVMNTLADAGYNVRKQTFTFPFFRDLSAPSLDQVSPTPTPYETATFQYSGSGDVTGELVPTNDVVIPPTPEPGSTSGCEASDFTAAPAEPAVALIQRGTCTFEVKATNAEAAGYDAVIIFNEGQEGRTELLTGTLGVPFDIPVVGLSFADGADLYAATQAGEVVVHVVTDTEINLDAQTSNIIATSKGGNPDKVLLVGAHLDSVAAGPGINDNGSGASTILEIARKMADLKAPRQKVRFAFWGAEEAGLLGSQYYVDNLSDNALARIFAVLNFDMVASPNYVRFVYDGDGSDSDPAGPAGSAQIEDVFTDYFTSQGLESDPTPFTGRSDYGPFIAVGIPAGGLFTGAEGIKTEEQAAVYGGTADVAYDECYHQACDTIANVNVKALSEMSDAAADATWTLARSKSGFFDDGSFKRPERVASSHGARGPQLVR
jgi:Zn-dependent M28 family amino/carboxypeptidase